MMRPSFINEPIEITLVASQFNVNLLVNCQAELVEAGMVSM